MIMRIFPRVPLILFALVPVALVLAASPLQAQQTPLVMEGKTTLFQRVLVRERSVAHTAPGVPGAAPVRPLQALYVYARQDDWVQVGAGDAGGDLFWLPAPAVTDWHQNIVATLEGSENVGRVIFFSDLDAAYGVVEAEAPQVAAAQMRQAALAAEAAGTPAEQVVALGPREIVDLRDNLYVLPILSAEQAMFESGAPVNLLEVAVARVQPADEGLILPPAGSEDEIRQAYKAAIVFVVDTTLSMQPYIDATRAALTDVFDRVSASQAGEVVSFGLIGYRDNLESAPGLEYDVRDFVSLQEGHSREAFLAGIAQMTEARVSSTHFREDAYAGIESALEDMDWGEFGARYIVLVTDAGPREAGDALSATGLDAGGLNALVKERLRAAIAVMHLRSPGGESDHASAEAAYRALSGQPNLPPLYFPVENGDADLYRDSARDLGQLVVDQVIAFKEGATQDPALAGDTALASAGRTMQLAYLGARTGARAPDVFEAVVADRDFDRTGLKPLSIRLLISKSELSDLQQALQIIVEKAEENVIDPDKFFAQVLGAAADMSRRPDQISQRGGDTLAEVATIDEYIEDLPYTSRIMSVTEDDWIRMSISEQQTIVNELHEKIERYRRYNEATDAWVDYLGQGSGADALVYPIRLDDLP